MCNNAGIKKYKSINKKIKKKHDKIIYLAKSKLNSIEVLISKDLIDSNISHNELVLINNVMTEFYDMKEKINNSNDKYIKQYIITLYTICLIFWTAEKIQKIKIQNL